MSSSKEKYEYSSDQDYCGNAEKFQSVPSYDETKQKLSEDGKNPTDADIRAKREGTQYSCNDDYTMGSIQDDKIYIATTDKQHERFAGKELDEIPPVDDNTRLSGYFSDQATVDACKDGDTLDNAKYNQMNQIAPYQASPDEDAGYKPHVDCFEIDRERMKAEYGTDDFNAAIAKCQANNQYGEGGGNQGYNPCLDEMISNGTLKHKPEESYSDANPDLPGRNKDDLDSVKMNGKKLDNSVVSKEDYDDMKENAETRSKDCVKNNTAHPSKEACQNGFPPNEHPVEGNTGNAKPVEQKKNEEKIGDEEEISTKAHKDNADNAENRKQKEEIPVTNPNGPSSAPAGSSGKTKEDDIQK